MTEKLRVYHSNDLDGVHVIVPGSANAAVWVIGNKHILPPEGSLMDTKRNFIVNKLTMAFHKGRKINPESLTGLDEFSRIAETYGIEMTKGATSGRTSDAHVLTMDFIENNGLSDHFTEVNLNPDKKNHSWKEAVVRKKIEEGYNMVIHLDDDIRAAMSVARVDSKRVIVYLIKNWSNSKPLLWIGTKRGLELPRNLYFADTVLDAALKFEQLLLGKAK